MKRESVAQLILGAGRLYRRAEEPIGRRTARTTFGVKSSTTATPFESGVVLVGASPDAVVIATRMRSVERIERKRWVKM